MFLGVLADRLGVSDFLPLAPVGADSGRWKPVVRGFPEGVEVLTEVGWVLFSDLFREDLLGEAVPFVGNGRGVPGWGVKELVWGQWRVGGGFPRVASVDPVSGGVVFVRPGRFMFFEFGGRLVRVKLRGVDMVSSLFADWWLHPRYGRGWRFVLADDVVRNVGGNYGLLNKFNVDMYGDWVPSVGGGVDLRGVVSGERLDAVGSGVECLVDSPIVFYPKKSVRRLRVWDWLDEVGEVGSLGGGSGSGSGSLDGSGGVRVSVPVFNVVVEPFHNVIVRRARVNDNPRTLWVGGPVVFGDGLDKSELRVSGVLGSAGALGGSYSVLRGRESERGGGEW